MSQLGRKIKSAESKALPDQLMLLGSMIALAIHTNQKSTMKRRF
jgi:hypothetical protein